MAINYPYNVLSQMTGDMMKVWIAILERAEVQHISKLGLTLMELSRAADVGQETAKNALKALEELGCIRLTPKGKTYTLTICADGSYMLQNVTIPFTFDDTDQTRLATLEAEVKRLQRAQKAGASGLPEVLKGEERDLILEVEGRRGYGLNHIESYLLGKCVARFGPERTKATWRQMQIAKDPIRATYGALQKGIKGKGAQQMESEPFVKVTYRTLDEGES